MRNLKRCESGKRYRSFFWEHGSRKPNGDENFYCFFSKKGPTFKKCMCICPLRPVRNKVLLCLPAFGIFMKFFYIILWVRNSIQGSDDSCELPSAQKLTDNNEVFTFRLSGRSMQPCYRMPVIGFRKIEFLFPLEEGIFMRKLNSQ